MFESIKNLFSKPRGTVDNFAAAPVAEPENLRGIEVIKHFTTDDEPKVVDYPRGKYKVYWEIVVGEVPGGYVAQIRFYTYDTGAVLEQMQYVEPKVHLLKPKVNKHIINTMAKYRR
jgi:hypothetical protein